MHSPIISLNCNNMDFGTIFTEVVVKAQNLQSELLTSTKIIEELSKEKQFTQKSLNEKSLHEELGCKSDQIVTFVPGFPSQCRDKTFEIKENPDVNNFDAINIDKALTRSGNVLTTGKSKYLKYKKKYFNLKSKMNV